MLCLCLIALFANVVSAQVNPFANCCDSYCYREDENPYLFMGSKTAYEFVFGKSSNQHIVPYCTPVHFWSLNRHGTRFPKRETIRAFESLQKLKENIIKNYDRHGSYPDTGRLCERDLEGFRRWQWNNSINENVEYDLTSQGRDDMMFLARRYQTKYPELLREPYSNQHYEFQYTDTERTRTSYEAFTQGLFGTDSYRSQAQTFNYASGNVTRNYKTCNAWLRDVKNNLDSQIELQRFKDGDDFKRVVAHVSRRLGFRYPLNMTIVQNMYDMCRFEKAWYIKKVSPWCAAFTKEQLKILEYMEDLKYYYLTGYGNPINQKLGCSSVKDMMDRFERSISNQNFNNPKVVMHFTHNKMLQFFVTALGINKDSQPLTGDNMRVQQRRLWRTSIMSPFSANLAAVLYQCNINEKYQVMFFLNEKPVDFPGCQVGLCGWNYLKEHLRNVIENCDLEFCDRGAANFNVVSMNLLFVLNIFILFWYKSL